MKIFWHGKTCFEIVISDKKREPALILIDPIDKNYPKKDTDILILTHTCEYNKKEKPFTISAAGEYEVKDVFVQSIPINGNNIVVLKIDGIKFCHLGKLEGNKLTDKEMSEIGRVDILFIGAGEEDKTKIINQLEPAIAIPMDYENIETFLKRMGEKEIQGEDYYKVQKKNFEEFEKTEIIVLNKK